MVDVNMLLMSNAKYFPDSRIPELKQMLTEMGPERASQVLAGEFKDPMVSMILGLVVGGLGVDRFYIGDTSMGALKLIVFLITLTIACLTCGILFFIPYIWPVIDLLFIMDATKEKNYQQLMNNIQYLQ